MEEIINQGRGDWDNPCRQEKPNQRVEVKWSIGEK